jgi:hypothetical protein
MSLQAHVVTPAFAGEAWGQTGRLYGDWHKRNDPRQLTLLGTLHV